MPLRQIGAKAKPIPLNAQSNFGSAHSFFVAFWEKHFDRGDENLPFPQTFVGREKGIAERDFRAPEMALLACQKGSDGMWCIESCHHAGGAAVRTDGRRDRRQDHVTSPTRGGLFWKTAR